jgi:hypothetical protein
MYIIDASENLSDSCIVSCAAPRETLAHDIT